MTNQQDPMIPPPELVEQWWTEFERADFDTDSLVFVATQAARWGSDQELEACCDHLKRSWSPSVTIDSLRAARRPKPPSLKEQALLQLDTLNADLSMHGLGCDLSQIRRALEALPDV